MEVKKLTVALVDDHQLVGQGMAALLKESESIKEVIFYADGKQFVEAVERHVIADVAVLDYDMPIMNGLTVIRKLKGFKEAPPVLIVSMHKEAMLMRELHREGIRGYVLKDESAKELLAAVEAIAKGNVYWGKGVAEVLLSAPVAGDDENGHFHLTNREMDVLKLLAEGKTSKQTAHELGVSPSTIDTHRRNLLAKFDVENTVQLIRAAEREKIL